jgi:hypothetical protein
MELGIPGKRPSKLTYLPGEPVLVYKKQVFLIIRANW